MKVVSANGQTPPKYQPLQWTLDDSESVPKTLTAIKALCSPTLCVDSKAFSSKDVLIKIDPLESATQAVTDIVVLSSSKKDQVPSGYSRLL